MKRIATVSQANSYIKALMDSDEILRDIWVQGEISNFKLHSSGHMYLSLKDENSNLRAVMFRTANERLIFSPENGMKVLAHGRISAYERDGQYQLYIDSMQPDGEGALYIAFEQLKAKLLAEGLFDESRKKKLPKFPKKVGVITSKTGAAIQDILNILKRRYPCAEVLIYPVLVQGDGAAQSIVKAIEYFNKKSLADVLIVGRGGGSAEDLWAFNDEMLARAIAASQIPVISAVGHETDFTICDFVSDLRAPTPSAAAELAVPSIDEIFDYLDTAQIRLKNKMKTLLLPWEEKLKRLETGRGLTLFPQKLADLQLQLDSSLDTMLKGVTKTMQLSGERIEKNTASLDALSPLKVLDRGYSIALKDSGRINSIKTIKENDEINLILKDGSLDCIVKEIKNESR